MPEGFVTDVEATAISETLERMEKT